MCGFWGQVRSSNGVVHLHVVPDGLTADVLEYPDPPASVHYEFGPRLALRNVDVPDAYEICYKAMYAKGLIGWKYSDVEEEEELKKSLMYLKPETPKL